MAAAVVVGIGEQAADDDVGIGDIALASDVFEVAAEAGEGVEAEAGLDDAPDDVAWFGRALGVPLVCDGFGDGSEFDDGEFAGEAAFEELMRVRIWEMVMVASDGGDLQG